jgi:hypothetical protein
MGREDTPRQLRRRKGFLFLGRFAPSRGCPALAGLTAPAPEPRHVEGEQAKALWLSLADAPQQVSPMSVYNIAVEGKNIDKAEEKLDS